jgi:predicted secreted protein
MASTARTTRSGSALALRLVMAAALLSCTTARSAVAEDEPTEPRHRVSFRVESTREVANDWIQAVVAISAEDVDPAALAETVNRAMAWGLEQARAEKRVQSKSGGYNTYPVYDDGKLRRWRASQELILEGGDSDAMTALVGTLQSRLQLQSFQFSVSQPTRARVEEELVAEALAAFQARAELVRKALGASGYAIDEISVDTGGHEPPIMRGRFEAMAMDTAKAAPAVEAGSSRVVVSAQGSIALE